MNTDFFLPPGADGVSPAHLARLAANALSAACRDARFKKLTGWRGLAHCQGGTGAFTCRIAPHQGVFGIDCEGVESRTGAVLLRCGIHYFPDPDETLCDTLRLDAAVATQHADYATAIRSFVTLPALRGPFRMGRLDVAAAPDGTWLLLRTQAEERRRVIADEGIGSPQTGWAVRPGETEEDMPALSLARHVTDVVAAAVTACTGMPPRFFRRATLPAFISHRDAEGALYPVTTDDASTVADTLAWGDISAIPSDTLAGEGQPCLEVRAADAPDAPLPEDRRNAPVWFAHDLEAPRCTALFPRLADRRPTLVVVGGFLGSGKTTFLNNCIEYHRARERFVAVIQNEVGATGVDARLMGDGAEVLALDEGCVCCSLAGSLAGGIRAITADFTPEVILLETTGLANPLNLLAELDNLRDMVRLDAVVTVVDAANIVPTLRDSDIARDQIRGADIIVCNKCDTVDETGRAALRATLTGLNGRAALHETSFGRIHPSLFMALEGERPPRGLMPAPHGTHATHADEGFAAVRLFFSGTIDEAALAPLLQQCPGAPFRIKGIVRVTDDEAPRLVQCVGARCEVERLDGGFEGTPFLVFIGRNPDETALLEHWAALGATAEPPAPQAEADTQPAQATKSASGGQSSDATRGCHDHH